MNLSTNMHQFSQKKYMTRSYLENKKIVCRFTLHNNSKGPCFGASSASLSMHTLSHECSQQALTKLNCSCLDAVQAVCADFPMDHTI